MDDDLENPEIVTEALALVDSRFRAISSLWKKGNSIATPILSQDHDSSNPVLFITVETYNDSMNGELRKKMERYGRIVDVAERAGDDDCGGIYGDMGWNDSANDYDDEIDIDNDSDH